MALPIEIRDVPAVRPPLERVRLSGAGRPRRDSFLAFSPPLIGDEEVAAVVETLRSEWLSTGPRTRQFANEFADYVGAPAALPLNSCTAALHTSLVTLEIGPGDEVITTPMTFASSVNVIEHVGATPVLVDVERDTLNIDPAAVERAITPRTRAILAVHYAGHAAELQRLRELAATHGIALVEDAAHAVAARYRGALVGSASNPVAFSFYATKNLTTGEGGMLTGDAEFIERSRVVSLHGMSRDAWKRYEKGGSWRYEILLPGFKYNMSDIQAALGLCQLHRLEAMQARRRAIVRRYQEAFAAVEAFEVPVARAHVEHAWHLYVLRLAEGVLRIDRDRFVEELTSRNIGTSVHFIPVHVHPFYARKYGYRPESLPVAYDAFTRMLSLPLNARMSDDDVEDVIAAVLDIAGAQLR